MIQLEPIYRPVASELKKDDELLSDISAELNPPLDAFARAALSQRGKRLRPALLLLSNRAVGGDSFLATAAAAVELIHSAALLHDDVVDHAEMRRGSLTLNTETGRSLSIVLGNYLYSKAFGLLADTDGARRELSSATKMMCSGEALELSRRGIPDIKPGEYLHAAGMKTASLTSACCSLGARLGGASSGLVNSLATYGFLLGLAFQIRDDCLDLGGDAMVIGKECCKDISERNATLPLILALPSMSRDERRRVSSIFAEEQAIDNVWFVKAVSENGGIEKSMEIARDFAERALRSVALLGGSEAKESLRLLASYSVERDS
jgi:octaprenyl-diphosphate synthase